MTHTTDSKEVLHTQGEPFNENYVDIPQLNTEEWLNVKSFETQEEAIAYAKQTFGADDNGMVSLISPSITNPTNPERQKLLDSNKDMLEAINEFMSCYNDPSYAGQMPVFLRTAKKLADKAIKNAKTL